MGIQMTTRVQENVESLRRKQEAQVRDALNTASQKLKLAVEKWTELIGRNNPIALMWLTKAENLDEIQQFTNNIRQLDQAADIGKDSLRILAHPALPLHFGLERTRDLGQNTQLCIHMIAHANSDQERSQYINKLKGFQIQLKNAEHSLNEIANPLSTHNRKIDRNLTAGNVKTDMQLDRNSSWNVVSVAHMNEIRYMSTREQANFRYQQQKVAHIKTQVVYNPLDPPLALVEKVVAGTNIESFPEQPIQLTLFIERATQGFRSLLIEGEKEPIRLSILPVKREQVVELGAKIRNAILLNVEKHKYYNPKNKFSHSEMQEDWKELADTGTTILKEIFDPPSLELLKKRFGRKSEHPNHLPLSLRIETEDFFLPWEMLAWPENSENEPLEYRFWGFLYNISRSVIDTEQKITKPQLIADTRPDVLFFTWRDDDPQVVMMEKFQQQKYINLSKVLPWEMTEREQELKDLPVYLEKPLHIVHFGCHAEGADSEENAKFRVNHNFDLKLRDFIENNCRLLGNPLVFMNACETGIVGPVSSKQASKTNEGNTLAPKVAADFVRVFLRDLGACGIIATEYLIPMDFAPEFAKEFYLEFLSGEQNAGEALLQVRQKFLWERHNPLGLFFSAYLEPETRISIQHPQRSLPMNVASRTFIVADMNTTVNELSSVFDSPPEYVIVISGQFSAKFGILSFAALETVASETSLLKHPKLHVIGKNQIMDATAKDDLKENAVATHGMVILTKHGVPVKLLVPETLGSESNAIRLISGLSSHPELISGNCPNCKESATRQVAHKKGEFIHYCSNCLQLWV